MPLLLIIYIAVSWIVGIVIAGYHELPSVSPVTGWVDDRWWLVIFAPMTAPFFVLFFGFGIIVKSLYSLGRLIKRKRHEP